jgi:hypothetical protein
MSSRKFETRGPWHGSAVLQLQTAVNSKGQSLTLGPETGANDKQQSLTLSGEGQALLFVLDPGLGGRGGGFG